jgi:hypothetical protein
VAGDESFVRFARFIRWNGAGGALRVLGTGVFGVSGGRWFGFVFRLCVRVSFVVGGSVSFGSMGPGSGCGLKAGGWAGSNVWFMTCLTSEKNN